MAATSEWRTPRLHVLVQAGADITRQDQAGKIPLHYAAAGGCVASAKLLLDAGSPCGPEDSVDLRGVTPAKSAAVLRHTDLVRMFVEHAQQHAPPRFALHRAARSSRTSPGGGMGRAAVGGKAEAHEKKVGAGSKTRHAASTEAIQSLAKCIGQGRQGGQGGHGGHGGLKGRAAQAVAVNELDGFGLSALHCAVASNNVDAVEALLCVHGVDVDVRGGGGWGYTPLQVRLIIYH